MAELLDRILKYFQQMDPAGVDSMALAIILEEDHQKIVGAIKSLQSIGGIIEAEQMHKSKLELTGEGKYFVKHGSHEAIVYHAVPAGDQGILQADLFHKCPQSGKIGLSKAIKSGWVHLKKDGKDVYVCRTVKTIVDDTAGRLTSIAEGKEHTLTDTDINELKKRKLLTQAQVAYYHVRRGANFSTTLEKPEADLTPEMMATGEWKTKHFKPYNFEAKGAVLPSGHLHPLMKVRSEFRQILLEMGFSEMPTNRFVESSFWNFDALYVPQKHPARDAQDTFFMSRPAKARSVPMEYLSNVKAAHTGKGYGTLGYGPVWKEEEAYKNVLRTHTTAVSARMLYEIGSQKPFKPAKLFSIDRVFRNETLDATHLAEFHQVEGVVADYKLSLGTLIGLMKEFFKRLGIDQIRFKPAYNPYTEPSMEVFSYHEGLKKWVEVGNSGMFRPEMLEPMGLPKDVRIVAWGLSLERPTMIRYGIDNIRDLVGHKVDLQMVYDNPLCRLDKKSNKEENKKDKAGKKEDKENDKAAKKEKKKPKENKENAKGGNKEKKDETSFDNGTEEAGPSLDEAKPKKKKNKSKKQEAESPSSPPATEVTFSKPIPLPAPPPPEQSPTEAVAAEEKVTKSKNKKRKKKSKKGNTTENTNPPTNGPKLETSQTEAIKSEEVEIPVSVADFGVAPVLLETLPEKTSKKKQKQKRQEQSSSTSTASEISAETLESLLPVVPIDKLEDLTSPTTETAISLSSSEPQASSEPVAGTTQQENSGGGKKKKRNRKPKVNQTQS